LLKIQEVSPAASDYSGVWTLMPSTPSACPQVAWRRFASSDPLFPQVTPFYTPGSIPGSSTEKMLISRKLWPVSFFTTSLT